MKNINKQSGFTLVETLIIFVVIALVLALAGPRILSLFAASNERQTVDQITNLYGGAIRAKGGSPTFSGVTCNQVASGEYGALSFSNCSNANPYGGNYSFSASGSSLTISATNIDAADCTRIVNTFTSTNRSASCSGGTLTVTY